MFPDGDTQFWLTERIYDVGDKLTHDGQTWIVTSLGNFNRDGKALAVTLRSDDEPLPQPT